MQDKKYDIVLAIAGSDSGGGACIQADIKTISACGCYAATAITAVTVQNTVGVAAVEAITPQTLAAQIDAVLSDIGADAIKIGMLHSSETILYVKAELEKASIKNIVLDPVMVATSGHRLIEESAIETLKTELIPMSRVITPNIPEAEILLGKSIGEQAQMQAAARELAEMYNVSVLLKAGHLNEDRLVDYLYDLESETLLPLESKRLNTNNTHGTGCTLSSALASFLAQGFSLPESATRAKKYIEQAIIAGAEYKVGNGHGPVKHFWELWR